MAMMSKAKEKQKDITHEYTKGSRVQNSRDPFVYSSDNAGNSLMLRCFAKIKGRARRGLLNRYRVDPTGKNTLLEESHPKKSDFSAFLEQVETSLAN